MNINTEKIYNSIYNTKNLLWEGLKDYYAFTYIKIYFGLIVFVNVCLWLAVWKITAHAGQNLYILHYNADFGVDLVGEAKSLYILPNLGLVILLLNGFLPAFFLKRVDFNLLAHAFLSCALLSNIFLAISLFSLYVINFQ